VSAGGTERLYLADSYRSEFEARILERFYCEGREGKAGVVLDRTCFYPTSGGQPHDTGCINGIRVLDVLEEGPRIVHVLEKMPDEASAARGEIDWARRFDHMQQHSGQHILSQCFLRIKGARTIGFHLGESVATIDIDADALSADEIGRVEREANAVVRRNLAVGTREVGRAEVERMQTRMRGVPETLQTLRIVDIGDYDVTTCAGTHVRGTAEVGIIKIVGTEKIRGKPRIVFVCGDRGLEDYAKKNDLVVQVCSLLSTQPAELLHVVEKRLAESREQRKTIGRLREELRPHEVQKLLAGMPETAGVLVAERIFTAPGLDAEEVKSLALGCAKAARAAVFFAHRGERARLFFSLSPDLPLDAGELMKEACAMLGGRGGGRKEFAEGGGPDVSKLEQALAAAAGEARRVLAGPAPPPQTSPAGS
jgi:alanyl-tRNA synthetase